MKPTWMRFSRVVALTGEEIKNVQVRLGRASRHSHPGQLRAIRALEPDLGGSRDDSLFSARRSRVHTQRRLPGMSAEAVHAREVIGDDSDCSQVRLNHLIFALKRLGHINIPRSRRRSRSAFRHPYPKGLSLSSRTRGNTSCIQDRRLRQARTDRKYALPEEGVGSSPQARKDLAEIERSPLRQAAPSTFLMKCTMAHDSAICLRKLMTAIRSEGSKAAQSVIWLRHPLLYLEASTAWRIKYGRRR